MDNLPHTNSGEEEEDDDDDESGDEDYCPQADSKRSADLSEEDEESANEDGDGDDDDNEGATRKTAAKRATKKNASTVKSSGRKRQADDSEVSTQRADIAEAAAAETTETTEQREKARADALWADFLSDTPAPSSRPAATATARTPAVKSAKKPLQASASAAAPPAAKIQLITETVEYAGEKIEITKEVPATSTSATASSSVPSSSNGAAVERKKLTPGPAARRCAGSSGGLSAILSQMNKPKKIGTLEKTKLDWTSFKRKEGIEEQLQTHNRGKDGYLDRQDFLERTDLRQFEIEKDMRQTSRRSGK